MKKIVITIILVLFFGAGIGYGGDKEVTSASNAWPPFVDPDNPGHGISIEIATAAFAAQGYTLHHKFMPWARAEHEVQIGKIDILPDIWYTDTRSKVFMYSKAYAANQVKFIKKRGDAFQYNGFESLTGKKVGIIIGYGYGDDFMNAKNFKREGVSDLIKNIRKLVSGRIDLTPEDEIVAKNTLKKHPELLKEIEFVDNPLSSNELYIACSLANPRHQELIGAFNKGLEAIMANGTFELIFERYGVK